MFKITVERQIDFLLIRILNRIAVFISKPTRTIELLNIERNDLNEIIISIGRCILIFIELDPSGYSQDADEDDEEAWQDYQAWLNAGDSEVLHPEDFEDVDLRDDEPLSE